jgi:hypothetical protein
MPSAEPGASAAEPQGPQAGGSVEQQPALDEQDQPPALDPPLSYPTNVNVSIRILSPGGDGGVSQGVLVGGVPVADAPAVGAVEDWTWTWTWTWDQSCAPTLPAATTANWDWSWDWSWTCAGQPGGDPVRTAPLVPKVEPRPVSLPLEAVSAHPPSETSDETERRPPTGRSIRDARPSLPPDANAPTTARPDSLLPLASQVVDSPVAARTTRASAGAPPGPDPAGGPPEAPRALLAGPSAAVGGGGGAGGSILLAALLGALVLLAPRGSGRLLPRNRRLRPLARSSRLERPG